MNNRKRYYEILRQFDCVFTDGEYIQSDFEKDNYSLLDDEDSYWTSNVEDIDGGDNFADYCKEFFNMLDEEEYYDN